jgi:hypothetical protein
MPDMILLKLVTQILDFFSTNINIQLFHNVMSKKREQLSATPFVIFQEGFNSVL